MSGSHGDDSVGAAGAAGAADAVREYGPLGPGHAPVKDPLKGLRGVMAGAMGMEATTFYLALTVILRVDGGAYWTIVNWVSITVLATLILLGWLQCCLPWSGGTFCTCGGICWSG